MLLAELKLFLIIIILLPGVYPGAVYKDIRKEITLQDSIVLAQSEGNIIIDKNTAASTVHLKANKKYELNSSKKYSLSLDGALLKEAPEGVYEIYLSPEKIDKRRLLPESSFFVDVLDTYTLASTTSKKNVLVNATRNLVYIAKKSKYCPDYFVTVLFKGNELPDKSTSNNAGKLFIESVRLMLID